MLARGADTSETMPITVFIPSDQRSSPSSAESPGHDLKTSFHCPTRGFNETAHRARVRVVLCVSITVHIDTTSQPHPNHPPPSPRASLKPYPHLPAVAAGSSQSTATAAPAAAAAPETSRPNQITAQ